MKVIKKGDTVKEVTCEECGCIFQYCKNDIQYQDEYHYAKGESTRRLNKIEYVNCPECDTVYIIKGGNYNE